MPIRIKQIRDSARGQPCTIEIPDVCNHDPETTVLAHYQAPGHGGMGTKPDDSSAAYSCSSCHDVLDGRVPYGWMPANEPGKLFIAGDDRSVLQEWYWFRGMRRTWKLLLENEVLTTGKSGTYRQGVTDRTATILKMIEGCTIRNPSLQKLKQAILELDS